eukprot:TRINITY_DN27830_c0_g1_i1.p1 TRINITY_DN27830_c0_g1~~TRINITY_DN27830_c0_g1_i1.p1  ORF type:complete len:629 (+),score=95.74 TRINITY_DN27830_c0_g1_i1:33-1919(+)
MAANSRALLLLVLMNVLIRVLCQEVTSQQDEETVDSSAQEGGGGSGNGNSLMIVVSLSVILGCLFIPTIWVVVRHPELLRSACCSWSIPSISAFADASNPSPYKSERRLSHDFAQDLREEVSKMKQDMERNDVREVQNELAKLRLAAESAEGGQVNDEENPKVPGQVGDCDSEPDAHPATKGHKKRALSLAIDTSTGFSRGCSPEEENSLRESLAFFDNSASPKRKASPRKGKSKSPAHSAINSPRAGESDDLPSPKRKARMSPRRSKSHSPRAKGSASPWGNLVEGPSEAQAAASSEDGSSRAPSPEPEAAAAVPKVEARRPSLSDQGLAELNRLCSDPSLQRKPSPSRMSFEDFVGGGEPKSPKRPERNPIAKKEGHSPKGKATHEESGSPRVVPGGRGPSTTSPSPAGRRPSTSEPAAVSPGGRHLSPSAGSPRGHRPPPEVASPGGRRPSTSAANPMSPLAKGRSMSPPASRRPSINAPQANPDPIEEKRPSVRLQSPPSRPKLVQKPVPSGPPMDPPFEGRTVLWLSQMMQSDGAQSSDKYSLIFGSRNDSFSIRGTRQTGAIEGSFDPLTHMAVWREKHPSGIVDVSATVETLKDGAAFRIVGEYQHSSGAKGSLILNAERR